jgi:hypothetical protein
MEKVLYIIREYTDDTLWEDRTEEVIDVIPMRPLIGHSSSDGYEYLQLDSDEYSDYVVNYEVFTKDCSDVDITKVAIEKYKLEQFLNKI